MNIIKGVSQLREVRRGWQLDGKVIGFVPTMGNLHQGHLNLVREAKKHADVVVVSIFVNPMQFGPDEDLDAYPRTLDNDASLLNALGVDAIFLPSVDDIYAKGLEQQTFVEVPGLSYMICGASRPGHFRGVATIVCKLFNMVQPNLAFFGEKDFQQLQVIKAMVEDLSMNLEVVGVPTTRENDGLAMSSRNQYLTDTERKLAPTLYEKMQALSAEVLGGRRDLTKLLETYKNELAGLGFKPDYLELRNAHTLLQPGHEDTKLVLLAAAFLGKTRLIDNLQISLV
jgi:pantoate--beta-alanine ligase